MKTNYKLPKDLNESLKNMEEAIIQSLLDSNRQFTIELNFEGLKFNKILKPIKAYKVINFMSDNNIAISSGSACSSSSGKPSTMLKNIGFKDEELYSNIRVSLGSANNKSEIDKFLKLIQECIEIF